MTPVVGTLIFRDMFDRGGPYWYWMQQLFDYRLFMNSTTVPLLIIFHSIWTATPFAMIVLFAGLQTLPQESLEAARVDGATWLRQLWHVAIPHLRSLFVFIGLISIMDSYRVFDSVFVLTQQNPIYDAETIMYYNFQVALSFGRLGKANAMSVLTVLGIFVVLIPFLVMTYREQTEERLMTRTDNPIARLLDLYRAGALHGLQRPAFRLDDYELVKLPKDANARIPRFVFSPTGENYSELWLNMTPEAFAPYGLALILIFFILVVIALSANRIPAPNSVVYIGCIFAGVIVALALPEIVNTAEFYDYLINSVIVTVGTLCVSLSIGALAGYGLARFPACRFGLHSGDRAGFPLAAEPGAGAALLLSGSVIRLVRHPYPAHLLFGCGQSALHHLDAAQLLHGDTARD